MTNPERRSLPDRRASSRGGRRPGDLPGFSPLVLVVDEDPHARELCETILAKLQFAVTSVPSVAKALQIMEGLNPQIIVARPADAESLRAQLANDVHGSVPVVGISDPGPDGTILVEQIRGALRARPSA